MVKVELLRPVNLYGALIEPGGEPVEVDAIDAAWMIERGLAAAVDEPKPKTKTKDEPSPVSSGSTNEPTR